MNISCAFVLRNKTASCVITNKTGRVLFISTYEHSVALLSHLSANVRLVYHGKCSLLPQQHDQHCIYSFEVTSTKKPINFCHVARNRSVSLWLPKV